MKKMTDSEVLEATQELILPLVKIGLKLPTIASILYEELVTRLETEDFDGELSESQFEGLIDTIYAFQQKHKWWAF